MMTATQDRINTFNARRATNGAEPVPQIELDLLARIRTSAGPMGLGVLLEEQRAAHQLWMRGWVTTARTEDPRYYHITDQGREVLRSLHG